MQKKKRSRQRDVETKIMRKADRAMKIHADGTYFQEGDHVRIKRTRETGRINATDGGVVYVLMDETNETKLFAAYADEDAFIELVTLEAEETLL
jgi:ribosomal protein S17